MMNVPIESTSNSNKILGTVLIVDDNPANIVVIADYLEIIGFSILVARDGESGLRKAMYAQPDIILLDVMMPGIDGFETCRRLKITPETKDIPVIFMTALVETEHKITGFRAGAVDYVTKPLQQEEVLARINTHLKIKQLTERLQEANNSLQQLNVDKDKFFSIVAHDLKGPFVPLIGNAELLTEMAADLELKDIQKMSQTIHTSAQRIMGLLTNLLQWSRLQMGHMENHPVRQDLTQVVQRAVRLFSENASRKKITVQNLLEKPVIAYADTYMVDTIIRNLVSNAVKFTMPDGRVTITASYVDYHKSFQNGTPRTDQSAHQYVELVVTDNGIGIKPEDIKKLFKIDSHHSTTGTAHEKGTGLGLIMCHEMVRRNGGEIRVESEVNVGTTFIVTLPAAEELPSTQPSF